MSGTSTTSTANVDLGIGGLINAGWQLYKKYWQPLLLVFIVYFVIEFVMQESAKAVVDSALLSFLVMIVSLILGLILQTGMITIGLKVVRDVKPAVNDLFGSVNKVANYFMVSLVYSLIVVVYLFNSGLKVCLGS